MPRASYGGFIGGRFEQTQSESFKLLIFMELVGRAFAAIERCIGTYLPEGSLPAAVLVKIRP
jgi:hypothetical protein